MYVPYQNTITVPSSILYEDLKLTSYSSYLKMCSRGKLIRKRNGGKNHPSLLEFDSLPPLFKRAIIDAYGDPYKQNDLNRFINQLENNAETYLFFQEFKKEDGSALLPEDINKYYAQSQVLNLYGKIVSRIKLKQHNGMSIKIGEAKQEVCNIIQELKKEIDLNTGQLKYPIGKSFPTNYRALDHKYDRYHNEGLKSLVPKYHSNSNSKKIKGEIADWILAFYCQPNKPVIPVLHTQYMKHRSTKNWPSLTESAIAKWLNDTKQRKVWVLERHGLQEWRAEFGHKLKRDRTDWFPNCYWAIDGTKLDWVHFKDNSQGMGADIKIDVVFDVYSERIIGYSYSTTENHGDHFNAVKMSVNNTMKRPFLFTYDGQSGHTTTIMQDLYNVLVAKNNGKHYKHAARQHGSPVEQLFSRFQQQILNTKWFSDKQGIRTRKLDSRPNVDFIQENKHQLSTIEKLEKAFEQCVAQWNNAKHPKYKEESRLEVHENHKELLSEPITIFEMMDMFWVSTKKAKNYGTDGINPVISGTEYHYEVYDEDGNVDLDFRDKYTHCKFFVQYDPSQMDNYVRLFLQLPNGNRQYVADAQPKRLTKQIPALMSKADEARMHKDRNIKKKELERIRKKLKEVQERTGFTPDNLIEDQELNIKLGGNLPKADRSMVESQSFLNRL